MNISLKIKKHKLGFTRRFQVPIQLGDKKTTIRLFKGFMVSFGDKIDLCLADDNNENSILIAKAVCTKVQHIRIYLCANDYKITVDGQVLTSSQFIELAKVEGFSNYHNLVDFLKPIYCLPTSKNAFVGVLISWRLTS